MNDFEWTIQMAFEQAVSAQGATKGLAVYMKKVRAASLAKKSEAKKKSSIGSPEQPPSLGHEESELLKNAKLATFHDGPLGLKLRYERQVSSVVISSVDEGSQAAEAGVVVGDIVIGVDGAPTRNRPKETVLMMIKAASRPFEMRLIGPEEYEALEAEWASEGV